MLLPIGASAPDFRLRACDGRIVSLSDFKESRALLVMFICNHCPYVKHVRAELARLGRDYGPKGVGIVAINSNDIANYPEDSPAKMAEEARDAGYTFPYLFDETQEVAKAYSAACTPDFFVFDGTKRLVYRGQLDDSRPTSSSGGNALPLNGADVRRALNAVLEGRAVAGQQKPSIGCNIKWKRGNEPGY